MTIDLYYMPLSAPCRSIMMVAKTLGLELNLKRTDLFANEHLTPEFIKLNPQHTIPTLVDDGLVFTESRAILAYLANKYGKSDSLYPKDPEKRGKIDQMMYFDMGTLYGRFAEYYYPQALHKQPADPEKYKRLEEGMGFLEGFLEGKKYAIGENLTIADFTLIATIATFDIAGFPLKNYPNVQRWYATCKATAPGFEENATGAEEFKPWFVDVEKKE